MPLSLDQFAHHLSTSGLLTSDEIAALRSSSRAADAEQFARELVKQQKLTAYQAQQVYSGRAKSLVLGNYVVLDKLGQGGMGMVLKAQHRRMNRIVALKVLSPTVTKTQEVVARFHREVQAAARLEHPNIVAAYDADEAHGTHFFVMQFVEGQDLSAIVKAKGGLPVEQAANCILQAARGLEFAHRQGVIHRDIKPANLLLDSKGVVKILDMGLARIEGDTGVQAELTNTGAVMGTIDYMAPEQALNTKSADARSDIYSLGISLWYLLVGRPAFGGDSLMARMLAHREAAIPSIPVALGGSGAASPQLLNGLDTVFQKMVAKRSADRYQSMTEVVAALESCLRGDAAEAPCVAVPSSEDSKFREFLDGLQQNDLSAGMAAAKKSKSRSKTATVTEQESEPTLSVSAADAYTDSHSFLSRPTRRRKQPAQRAWWQDVRVQIGGGLAAMALLAGVIVIAITNKDGSKARVTVPAEGRQSVEVTQGGQSVANVETTPAPSSSQNPIPAAKPLFPKSKDDLPPGFASLFNGRDLAGWKGQVLDPKQRAAMAPAELASAQAVADQRMRDHWRVEEGILVFDGKGDNLCTARDYSDFELYLEWKILPGGDSGVYLRGAPQVQIWDSAAKPNANNMGSGGLHNNVQHPNRPSVNADKPVGEWNAMLIRMVGEKVTVSLNGQLVAGEVVYENYLNRDQPIYASGPIELQKFGTPLYFRNLLIRELDADSLGSFKLEFDGVDDRVEIPALTLDVSQPLTIECWAEPSRSTPNSLVAGFAGQAAVRLRSGRWSFRVRPEGKDLVEATSLEETVRDHATHVAGVWDRTNLNLFVDGRPQGEPTPCTKIIAAPLIPSLGGNPGGGDHLVGRLSAVRFSKIARYSSTFVPPRVLESDADTLATFRFSEGQGDILKDSSGKNHHGKIVGAKWVAAPSLPAVQTKGAIDYELDLTTRNGEPGRAHISHPLSLDETCTVELYETPRDLPPKAASRGLFSAGGSTILKQFETGWIWHVKSGNPEMPMLEETAYWPVKPGQRVHLAGQSTPTEVRLYVNGRMAKKKSLSSPLVARKYPLTLGHIDTVGNWDSFHGTIDEVRISTVARYKADFTPTPRFEPDVDTWGLYHCDEGRGDTLIDSSGNNHHGKIVGAKWVAVRETR